MKDVRIGVVGLGFMGATHVTAIEAARKSGWPCRLTAVCDRDPQRRRGVVESSGNIDTGAGERLFDPDAVEAFEQFEDLIASDAVDAVCICTPTDSHVALGERALDSGRHVLVEKPLAVTADAARPLVEAHTRHRDLIAMPALCMRFWPGWSWLLSRRESGDLGAVRAASFRREGPRPGWAPGFYDDPIRSGGALVDLHIHDADFVRAFLGEPDAVQAFGTLDRVATSYVFDDGPNPVLAAGSWDHADGHPFHMEFVVDFEDATAEFDSRRQDPLRLSRNGRCDIVPLPATTGYDEEMRHFVKAVLGEEPLRVTLEDAVATARLLDRERRSIRREIPHQPNPDEGGIR